jgi:hypothetical protein
MDSRIDPGAETTRSALSTLSTVCAAIAGASVGALIGESPAPDGWGRLGGGLSSASRGHGPYAPTPSRGGYDAPGWQRATCWICWLAIAPVMAWAIFRLR